jgi:DNA-binding SARP family transcriptional activator
MLALEKGKAVPVTRLLDLLWDGDAPPSARTKLQGHVSAVRHEIAGLCAATSGLDGVTKDGYLLTCSHSYALTSDGVHLDLEEFDHLVTYAWHALDAGQWRSASEYCDKALATWHGPALSDIMLPRVRRIAETIEERRMLVLEAKAEADLALGRYDVVAADLPRWVEENPLRERLRALLMLALYRCGCRADALALYRSGREAIVAAVGLEPGSELQRLHHRMLAGDQAVQASYLEMAQRPVSAHIA